MNILVTGGAGFLGSHLCDRLVQMGHTVWCVDDLSTGTKDHLRPGIGFMNCDVRLVHHGRLGIFDQIYHLACPASPVAYQQSPSTAGRTSTRSPRRCGAT